jgi:hypothetical protein
MNGPCAEITEQIGQLFACNQQGAYIRIRTPYLYPDGDVIDLFYQFADHHVTLTDLGESLRWLRMQTIAPKRSPRQRQLIADICATHRVELYRGMLVTRLDAGETLASAVTRLSEACIRVTDLWFTLRTRAVQTITDEVADFLTERQIEFVKQEPQVGRSGRVWNVDFHTRTPNLTSFVQVLSTGSRDSAHRVSENVLASFVDLSHVRIQNIGVSFISLFDDSLDVWAPEDVRLLEDVSHVARWSRPDQFEQMLRAA